jgi:uncharacterized protein involved in exopolysaccharide biosynthesis
MSKNNWSQVLGKEVSINTLFELIALFFKTLLANLKLLLVLSVAFAALFALAGVLFKPQQYKAETIIVTDEQGPSAWESLLAQFGMDMATGSSSGVFQGESLVKLFLTRNMIERALLTKVPYGNKEVLIADIVWPETRHARKKVFSQVRFSENRQNHDALTDSALYLTQRHMRRKMLRVSKPDKKQNMIHIAVVSRDARLASAMAESLVQVASGYYLETITEKARINLDVLQHETDSVQQLLKEYLVRNAMESDRNINPLWQSMRIEQSRSVIDLQITVNLFGELIKNLKLAEVSLRKETPLIQIIEPIQFPLERTGFAWWEWALIGFAAGLALALYLIYLIEKRTV